MILDLKSPPTGRHDLGRWGERLIGAWYERNQRGVVIGTNVRLGSLELDVIVRDGALVRVVEVRTSARRPTHELSWSVVGKKMSRVRRAMERLVRCKDYHVDPDHLVLDVALVYVDRVARRAHIEVWFDALPRAL